MIEFLIFKLIIIQPPLLKFMIVHLLKAEVYLQNLHVSFHCLSLLLSDVVTIVYSVEVAFVSHYLLQAV